MKTGIIVYVVGDDPRIEDLDMHAEVRREQINADKVEVVSRVAGHFDVSDAWWSLTAKGMQRIFCVIGEITDAGRLHLKNRVLRLYG